MTDLYHITHFRNLPSIVVAGGLRCDSENRRLDLRPYEIGYQHIKAERTRRLIGPAAPGAIADYVPFYFAPRSPMLYVINSGGIQGHVGGQAPVIHLVVQAEKIAQRKLTFVFSDRHPTTSLVEWSSDLGDLDRRRQPPFIDWEVMAARYWSNTDADGERKHRRQAEFLVHQFVPWDLVHLIGVYDDQARQWVQRALTAQNHVPAVVIRRSWYY